MPVARRRCSGTSTGTSVTADSLVVWEAQFGDFANGAQIVIDQFLSSGEESGSGSRLVIMLPHGFDGQGPEHSAARLERLERSPRTTCRSELTTPAKLFHVLRRQLHRPFRKPLMLMTSKSLSRLSPRSRCADMAPVVGFTATSTTPTKASETIQLVNDEGTGALFYPPARCTTIFTRSGRSGESTTSTCCRVEQLYPFPTEQLRVELGRFRNARVVWCQEEPRNMGAGVRRALIREMRRRGGCKHPGRVMPAPTSAATATGLLDRHEAERAELLDDALRGEAGA